MGDPAGVGPEVVMGALGAEPHRAVVVGDAGRLKLAADLLPRGGPRLRPVGSVAEARFEPGTVNVLDLDNVPADLPWGELSAAAGRAGYAYVERAAALALAGEVAGVCTAPINKEAWRLARVADWDDRPETSRKPPPRKNTVPVHGGCPNSRYTARPRVSR